MHILARIILSLLLMAFAASDASAQIEVQLRKAISVKDVASVTLSDIAEIKGTNTDRLASLALPKELGTTTGDSRVIVIDDLRKFMLTAREVNFGNVALSGQSVRVRKLIEKPQSTEPTVTQQPTDAPPKGTSIRDVIPTRIALERNVSVDDLRITFNEADREVLDASIEGRSWSITPAGESDHLPLQVRIYSNEQLVLAKSIRVGVEVKKEVAIALRALRKGELIDPSLIKIESRWIAPSIEAAIPDTVIGKAARSQIDINSIIENRDAEEPIVVRKGERIVVDCMVDGVLVRSTMRAGAQARVGDVIVVQPLTLPKSARDKKNKANKNSPQPVQSEATVYARISSPGRGVVTTQPAADETNPSPESPNASRSEAPSPVVVTRSATDKPSAIAK